MLVVGHLIHKWKEKADPERIPNVEKDVFVFFWLKEGNAMDLELPQGTAIEFMEQAVQMPAQFFIEAGKELRDLLLGDRRREINIPRRQAGKRLGVAREQ